jgi:hypothetical protein
MQTRFSNLEISKTNDIQKTRVSTSVACKLRILREEMSENARFLKFGLQSKSYLFNVECLSDDYKFIAIVRSCNEACVCLHCLLQLPSLDPPPCNSPPLITLLSLSTPHQPFHGTTQSLPPNSPHPLIKSSHLHMHALLTRLFPHLQNPIFFGGLNPHTKVQPPQQHRNEKKEIKLLRYSSL